MITQYLQKKNFSDAHNLSAANETSWFSTLLAIFKRMPSRHLPSNWRRSNDLQRINTMNIHDPGSPYLGPNQCSYWTETEAARIHRVWPTKRSQFWRKNPMRKLSNYSVTFQLFSPKMNGLWENAIWCHIDFMFITFYFCQTSKPPNTMAF